MKRKEYTADNFRWAQWGVEDIKAVVPEILAEKKAHYDAIKAIPDAERNFENTIYAIESSDDGLSPKAAAIEVLMLASPEEAIRKAAQDASIQLQHAFVDIEYDEAIYKAVKAVEAKGLVLTGPDEKLFRDMLRHYRRMGFELPPETRELLKAHFKRLGELSTKFEMNVNKARDFVLVTREELEGLSELYINRLEREGIFYKVTVDAPVFSPFMEQAKHGAKRKELNDTFWRRGGAENIEYLKEVVRLRADVARLLGYTNYPDYVLEPRMAKRGETAQKFLDELWAKLVPLAHKEIAAMTELKRRETNDPTATFQYYDYYYYIEQWKKERFKFDGEKVREYFPFEVVKKGMLELYSKIFALQFERTEGFPVWHQDVEVYCARDARDQSVMGYFLLDLYPREGKYGHACELGVVKGHARGFTGDEYVVPVATMLANFLKPTPEVPSLLSVREVETFFHEFGHVIHDILTKGRYASQSGTSTARDFVEAPSQMLENWVLDKEMLPMFSGHYKDHSQKLPDDLLHNLLAAKHHAVGCFYTRQLIFGRMDFALHMNPSVPNPNDILSQLMKEGFGFDMPPDHLFCAGFGHLINYGAGYYGYLWSQVYSCDMFTRFEQEGLLNPKTGMDYREWILEKGSSIEEIDLVRGFLGREPNNEAFLREIGVGEITKDTRIPAHKDNTN